MLCVVPADGQKSKSCTAKSAVEKCRDDGSDFSPDSGSAPRNLADDERLRHESTDSALQVGRLKSRWLKGLSEEVDS